MTTLLVNVHDDGKVNDVLRFLRDIDFLEVIVKDESSQQKMRRKPDQKLSKTRIIGNIVDPIMPDSGWEALRESGS